MLFFGVLTAGTFSRENMNQELGPVCIYLGACSSTFMLIKFFPVLIKKRERPVYSGKGATKRELNERAAQAG